MRRLVYFVASTLDGFIAAPDGGADHFPMGDHVMAQARELPETLPAHLRAHLGASSTPARFDTVLMGRRTYDPALTAGIEDPYAPLDTVVFSRELAPREGRLRITAEDPVSVVRALKARPGRDLWLCGGGKLAAQLAGQIDELTVKLNPLLTGSGLPLIPTPFQPRQLRLMATRTFDSGVVWLTYDLVR